MQYYFPSLRKLHENGNLASWMMLHGPPTSASLFWFYYRHVLRNVKGLLDYAISLLRKKNCTENCKQEQHSQPDVVRFLLYGFLLRATLLPSDCSTFIEGGFGTLSIRLLSFLKGSSQYTISTVVYFAAHIK